MTLRIIFKTLARIDFIKSILKLNKSNADSIVVLAQPQVLNEKPAVVMQHETPTTEEPRVMYKIVVIRYIDARDIYCTCG
jgi:hypothetical protein